MRGQAGLSGLAEGGRRCANCGAAAPRLQARFCEFCGHELPRPAATPAPAGPFGDVEARFAEIAGHPELEAMLRWQPPVPPRRPGETASTVLALVAFVGGGIALTFGFAAFFPPMAIFPLLVVGIGAISLVGKLMKDASLERGPLQATVALVAGERTKISGLDGGPTATRYFTTLQLRDGSRFELETVEEVSGKITAGDIGVAYTKGRRLVGFSRFQA